MDSMNTVKESLTTYAYPDKLRLGNKGETVIWGQHVGDGGYVIANIKGYDCYISAGVNEEESFTRDFLPWSGLSCEHAYAFDGTIVGYPYKYTRNIHFVGKNIDTVENEKYSDLRYLIRKYKDIFLKMDIEGGEWRWLACLTREELQHFKQIAIEIHSPCDDDFGAEAAMKRSVLAGLAADFYLVHAHANNNGPGWGKDRVRHGLPTILELTYVRRDAVGVPLPMNTTPLPIAGLDVKNAPYDDMALTEPPFCFPTSA